MGNNAVRSSLPFVHAECDEEDDADDEIGIYMRIAPLVSTASPVEREQQKRCSNDDEEAADRVACPSPLLKAHPLVVGPFLRPV